MSHKSSDTPIRHEVIQRYCPQCGDNVIMLRTYGEVPRLQCMSYDLCDRSKTEFCHGILTDESPLGRESSSLGVSHKDSRKSKGKLSKNV